VLASKLLESAERRWRMVNVPHLVALVRAGRPSSAATWSSDPTSMRPVMASRREPFPRRWWRKPIPETPRLDTDDQASYCSLDD